MAHFTIIAPPFTSHVRALVALAGDLLDKGHRISWVHQAEVQPLPGDRRIEFRAVGALSHPAGSLARTVARAARPGGPLGLHRVIADVAASSDMLCCEAPALLRALGTDAVIADQTEAAGGLVASGLGLPFMSVACALPVNREPRLPLPVMPWTCAVDARGEQLNEGSARVHDWLMRPHARVTARHARAFGIGARSTLADCLSPRAQISQATASFDFPRIRRPAHFHAVGPLRPPLQHEPAPDLPVNDARPFVFASLGTLQSGRFGLFKRIARACRALDVLLLAHCDRLSAAQAKALRHTGATWVTGFAPQRAAPARADVVISHAGLRLQPALASAARLEKSLHRLLGEPAFAERARLLGADAAASGGVPRAVGLIEAALVNAARCAPPFVPAKEPAYGSSTAAAAQAARRQHA
ncbi:MAG: glycosyltransferase [Polaromonas sp.]|nr:glycosyltransferase [Polaromonas sp.]